MNMHDEEFQVRVVTSSSSDHHVGLSSSIAITCGHPGNPAHGLTNGSEFNLNDVVNFTCSPGYLLQGASRAQCRSNGQWSSPLPTCRGRRVPSQRGWSHTRGPICLLGGLLHTLSMWWDNISEDDVQISPWSLVFGQIFSHRTLGLHASKTSSIYPPPHLGTHLSLPHIFHTFGPYASRLRDALKKF